MTHKLIVGYRTRLADGFEALMPTFTAPSNWKDPAKIEAEIAAKQQAFKDEAKDMPYTGTFDEVVLVDPKHDGLQRWEYRAPDSGKQPICLAVRAYLTKHWKTAWTDDTHNRKPPEVIFVGFNPRTFLKILGLECSLPHVGKPLPLGLWYSNTDHRDIGTAILPDEFKRLTVLEAVKARRPRAKDEAEKWDQMLAGWNGPGQHPEKDAVIAIELAAQLGMLKG